MARHFNKLVVAGMAVLLFAVMGHAGNVKDRDGNSYRTVKIGSQTWMAENLNVRTKDSWCYNNNESKSNCQKYGRLYTWNAAMEACPSGWHLPSKSEFEMLIEAVGGEWKAGKMLKSKTGWSGSGNGTDAYAFSALPAGLRDYDGYFRSEGDCANFWSSTGYDSNHAYSMLLYDDDLASLNGNYKDDGFSVRCLKD
jgi:uncharacterized protein (TIGR02145 family)